jgi:NhaA family Na+:H+ antiporter
MFALANAGIPFGADSFSSIADPIALGVMAGLLLGKPAGVLLGSWIAITLGIARMPEGVTWSHMIGVGFLAGIGFTMSLFITGLAFSDEALSLSAKAGILLASGGAGSSGWIILQRIPVKIDAKI